MEQSDVKLVKYSSNGKVCDAPAAIQGFARREEDGSQQAKTRRM